MQSLQHPICSTYYTPVPSPITCYIRICTYMSILSIASIFQSAFIFLATFPPSGQFTSFLLSGEEVPQLSVLIDLGAARPLKANEKRKQWWELCFDFQNRSPSSTNFQLLTLSLCFEIWFHHNSRRKTLNLSYFFEG